MKEEKRGASPNAITGNLSLLCGTILPELLLGSFLIFLNGNIHQACRYISIQISGRWNWTMTPHEIHIGFVFGLFVITQVVRLGIIEKNIVIFKMGMKFSNVFIGFLIVVGIISFVRDMPPIDAMNKVELSLMYVQILFVAWFLVGIFQVLINRIVMTCRRRSIEL